jgi:hypothetical protein
MIEIHLDGKPVTKLEAARALCQTGSGQQVRIGVPGAGGRIRDDITVRARRWAYGTIQRPELGCMSFHADTLAEMRLQAQMITLAAEVAELAEMLAAEQAAA